MILPNPQGQVPTIHESAFVAPTAVVIGNVEIGPEANIWFGAVIRGDWGGIKVGARTSVQENCMLHVEAGTNLEIGHDCVLGHGAIIHGPGKVGDKTTVGIGAIVMQGCSIGTGCIVAGGAVARGKIPDQVLVAGVPAVVKKQLPDSTVRANLENANMYVNNGKYFKEMLTKRENTSPA